MKFMKQLTTSRFIAASFLLASLVFSFATNAKETTAQNSRVFISADWLHNLIQNKAKTTPQAVVLEASWGAGAEYNKGHIPGSIHLDTNTIETEANNWNILSSTEIEKVLLNKGITHNTLLVIYSNDIRAASRVAFTALWAGVKDVRVLNGGFNAWKKAGFAIETKENKPIAATSFGIKVPAHPEYLLVTPQEVLEAQKNPNFRLVSLRSWDEFIGKISGYSYIKGAGEPKGAIWGRFDRNTNDIQDYLNADGTIIDLATLESKWATRDISKSNEIAFYCGTGWRATMGWLLAYEAGWNNIKVYDGGWFMWEKDPSLPVQKGDPSKSE